MELATWLSRMDLSCVAVDVVLLVLTELVFRLALNTGRHIGKHIKLSLQLFFLILVTLCVNALHHLPYLLLVCDVVIAGRILASSCPFRRRIIMSRYFSKPLTYADTDQGFDADKFFSNSTDSNSYHPFVPEHSNNHLTTTRHIVPTNQRNNYYQDTGTTPPVKPHQQATTRYPPSSQNPLASTLLSRSPMPNTSLQLNTSRNQSTQTHSVNNVHKHSNHHQMKPSPSIEHLSPLQMSAKSYFPSTSTYSLSYSRRSTATSSNFPSSSYHSSLSSTSPFYSTPSSTTPFYSSPSSAYHTPSSPPGLVNAGNTCFLNSIIQCLAHSDFKLPNLLNDLALSTSVLSEVHTPLVQSLLTIMEQCNSLHGRPIDMTELLLSISLLAPNLVAPRDAGGGSYSYQSQQDAAEFLLWLLDTLHSMYRMTQSGRNSTQGQSAEQKIILLSALEQERSRLVKDIEIVNSSNVQASSSLLQKLSEVDLKLYEHKENSPVRDLCYGQLIEARECQQCRKISVNVEYFAILPVPVPSSSSTLELTDCFRVFSEVEDLTQDTNMLHCLCALSESHTRGTGQLTPGKRLALLGKLPNRLLLQLTRFSYDVQKKVRSMTLAKKSGHPY